MATQQALDKAYMGCAFAVAKLSHAVRRKVGAIVVGEHGIIAEGVNGMPSGFDNCCEVPTYLIDSNDGKTYSEGKGWVDEFCTKQDDDTWLTPRHNILREVLVTKPECLHAESNAIAKIARSTNSSVSATLYCTLEPCFSCAKSIIQAGMVRVVYAESYVGPSGGGGGSELLQRAKIQVEKYND